MLLESGQYQRPEWSSMPYCNDFALEVIKQGVVVGQVPLTQREYFLIGRQLDRVHIPAEHLSVSRVHAVLNFHRDGSLMLCDLGSAQGTFINKRMLEKQVFSKVNVGDVIKFAQSTRIYVVKGPEEEIPAEYNSANLEQLRREAEEREQVAKRERERREQLDTGVTWGISMDDDYDEPDNKEEDEEVDDRLRNRLDDKKRSFLPEYLRKDENYDRKYGERYEAPIREEEVKSKKDQEILEKIRKKEKKIQNMQEENRRIYMKEQSQDDGLTEGQLAAVSRNDKAIEQLSEEIDQLVNQIRSKYSEGSDSGLTQSSAQKRQRLDEDKEDNNLLDTTNQTADASTNWRLRKKLNRMGVPLGLSSGESCEFNGNHRSQQALSYEEIKEILDTASARLMQTQHDIQSHITKAQDMQLKLALDAVKQGGDVDEIEKFITQDQIKESQNKLKGLHAEEMKLEETVQRYSKLLSVATPALFSLLKSQSAVSSNLIQYEENLPASAATSLKSIEESRSTHSQASSLLSATTQTVTSDSYVEDSTTEEFEKSRKIALEDFKKFVEEEKRRMADEKMQSLKGNDKIKPITVPASNLAELDAFERKLRDAAEGVDSVSMKKDQDRNYMVGERQKSRSVVGPTRSEPSLESNSSSVSVPTPSFAYHRANDVLESGEYVWVPPKKQTGDGRTSLNDKFGY